MAGPGWSLDGPGERYECPVPECSWHLDVPAPVVEPLERVGDDYVLAVTEVPMAAVEAAVAEHLRGHDPAGLSAAVRAALDRY
jgi:hypothetical protein